MRFPFPLLINSERKIPTSIVLPKPTPSAINSRGRGSCNALRVGVNWYSAGLMAALFAMVIFSENTAAFLICVSRKSFVFR